MPFLQIRPSILAIMVPILIAHHRLYVNRLRMPDRIGVLVKADITRQPNL